jgi:hypothetical protein
MLYKPNFCNQCGETIERAEWGVATSRRFCDLCATEHPILDWAPKLLVAFFGLTVLFGMKSVVFPSAASPNEGAQKPAEVRTLIDRRPSQQDRPEPTNGESVSPITNHTSVPPALSGSKPAETFEQPRRVNKSTESAAYTCGAPTKKGTPCSRKVKVKGYCWQHRETTE